MRHSDHRLQTASLWRPKPQPSHAIIFTLEHKQESCFWLEVKHYPDYSSAYSSNYSGQSFTACKFFASPEEKES
jgi:hypothetical protein